MIKWKSSKTFFLMTMHGRSYVTAISGHQGEKKLNQSLMQKRDERERRRMKVKFYEEKF
jgi:hypothetical protein